MDKASFNQGLNKNTKELMTKGQCETLTNEILVIKVPKTIKVVSNSISLHNVQYLWEEMLLTKFTPQFLTFTNWGLRMQAMLWSFSSFLQPDLFLISSNNWLVTCQILAGSTLVSFPIAWKLKWGNNVGLVFPARGDGRKMIAMSGCTALRPERLLDDNN